MAEWGCVRSFGVDDGELDGFSPAEVFVLGYELAQVDAKIAIGKAFDSLVHSANRDRIESELKKRNRQYKFTYMQNDQSEDWMQLFVSAE